MSEVNSETKNKSKQIKEIKKQLRKMKKGLNEMNIFSKNTKKQITDIKRISADSCQDEFFIHELIFNKQKEPFVIKKDGIFILKDFTQNHNVFSKRYSFKYELNLWKKIIIECLLEELQGLRQYLRALTDLLRRLAMYSETDSMNSGRNSDSMRADPKIHRVLPNSVGISSEIERAPEGIVGCVTTDSSLFPALYRWMNHIVRILSNVFAVYPTVCWWQTIVAGVPVLFSRLLSVVSDRPPNSIRVHRDILKHQPSLSGSFPGILRITAAGSGDTVCNTRKLNSKKFLNFSRERHLKR